MLKQHPDAVAVFYGEHTHATSLQLPIDRVVCFPLESKNEFAAFVATSNDVVVATGQERFEETRDAVATTHELVASGVHKRVYMGRKVNAHEAKASRGDDGALH